MLFLLPSILVVAISSQKSQALDGHWEGQWVRNGAQVEVEYNFAGSKGFFTSMPQAVLDYPLDKVERTGDKVEFVLGGEMKFVGVISRTNITGKFDDGEGSGSFSLRRTPKRPLDYSLREVTFGTRDARLAGSLCVPKGKGPFPAILLLHGSGPQTRWGTLRYVADFMARHGIASLCWDQRGSGDSGGQWYKSNYDDLVGDAKAGIALLQGVTRVDSRSIGVYGHSQGSTICPLLASRTNDLSFIIAGAPIIGPVFEQDLHRVRQILTKRFEPAETEKAMAYYRRWVDAARTGKGRNDLESETTKVKGEKWFDTVEAPGPESYIWSYYPPIGNFNPLPLWSRVKQPSLILYGERDEIEDVAQYALKVDSQFRRAKNKDFTIIILPRARHELKVDSEPNAPFEWRRPSPGLYELMLAWIKLRFEPKRLSGRLSAG